MDGLTQKRMMVLEEILMVSSGSALGTAAPTPSVELPKQVVLGAAELHMIAKIWSIYFNKELNEGIIVSTLQDIGLVTAVAAGTGWVITKTATGVFSELTNIVGPIGWLSVGVLSLAETALLGAAFAIYCDKRYRKGSAGDPVPV